MNAGLHAHIRQGLRYSGTASRWPVWVLALLLPIGHVNANDIYSYTDEQGSTVFTDEPREGAERITVEPPPPIPLRQLDLPAPAPIQAPEQPQPPKPIDSPSQTPAAPPTPPAAEDIPPVQPVAPITPPEEPPATQERVERVEHEHGGWTEITTRPPPGQSAPAVPAQDLTEASADIQQVQAPSGHYATFVITRPAEKVVALGAGGTLHVELALEPELDRAAGDRIEVLIDDVKRIQGSTGLRHLISGVEPGARQIRARIVRDGSVVHQTALHPFTAQMP